MPDYFPLRVAYTPKTPFWTSQQRDCFDLSADMDKFFIAHEPRCGKSKIVVDTCRHNRWGHGLSISAALIVAWPNGAHEGWVLDAFPESYGGPWAGVTWNSDTSKKKPWRKQFDDLLSYSGFAVMTVGADSLESARCRADIGTFLSRRKRVMAVGDESDFMVNEQALRSRIMHNISHGPASKFVAMRRVLTGTPCDAAGPLDFYSQVGFLDWDILGYRNPTEFAKHYAEVKVRGRESFWSRVKGYEDLPRDDAIEVAKGWRTDDKLPRGRDWWTVVDERDGQPQFRNMDEFWQRLGPYIHRATFAECFPDAQRPDFRKLVFDLTDEQRRVYDALAKEFRSELADGTEVKVEHHLTRILRLQQVACNYWPERSGVTLHAACRGMGCDLCDDSGIIEDTVPAAPIDGADPRLDAIMGELREGVPAIYWSRFRHGIDAVMEACRKEGIRACQYDGRIGRAEKLENRQAFQRGEYDVICCNQAAASRGLPLFRAEKHVCGSNVFSYRTRKQLEERAEHGRKVCRTRFIDVIARGTVDDLAILPALRQGMSVATYLLGDKVRSWI